MMRSTPRSVEMLDTFYGVRFLVRVAFDVPIENGVVQNDFRIKSALSTIAHIVEKGGRAILLTHIGRDSKNSTKPLLAELQKYFPTTYVDAVLGEKALGAVTHMKEGTVLLLENLRSCAGEEANDLVFAQELASYGNFYVNEAFAVSHRAHASIVTLPTLLPNFAGISFLQEHEELTKSLNPEHPSLFILGGAKFETKAPLVEKFISKYSHVYIGGAIANDFLKGKGYEVGASLLSKTDLSASAILNAENLILPIDVVTEVDTERCIVSADAVSPRAKILDVGPESIDALAPYIAEAKTILWNGPLGNFEAGFGDATKKCATLIGQSDAFSVVGGGDTIAAIEELGISESFGFLSTAGGAMLEFLEKGTLPGIDVLSRSE
jgi:phosphoglycerate kinase